MMIIWSQIAFQFYPKAMENKVKAQILLALAKLVKLCREKLGMTQKSFAGKSGRHRTCVVRVEGTWR